MLEVAFLTFLALAIVLLGAAWSVTYTFTMGQSGGSVSLSDTVAVTGTVGIEVNVALAPSTTNQLVPIAYVSANIKGVYIRSDQDVTIKVDSTGSPEQTIVIKAGIPYTWYANSPAALLLATDANTGWYLTNATAGTANFYARILN